MLPAMASMEVCLNMQGEIRIKGQTRHGLLADDPALAEQLKLGMVFQNGALFDSLSVGENVGFMLYEHTRMLPARVEVPPTLRLCCFRTRTQVLVAEVYHPATGHAGCSGSKQILGAS